MSFGTEIKVTGGVNQIMPNATYAIQQFYMGKENLYELFHARACDNEKPLEGTVEDMYYYSVTRPHDVLNEVPRKVITELCEKRLETNNVLCLYGEEGIGLTTILAQFAKNHSTHCVSYFANELDAVRMDSELIEQEIVRQLYWYINGNSAEFNISMATGITIQSIYAKVLHVQKKSKRPLYFVFDGFDNVPTEKFENIKRVFDSLPWTDARFIFTGDKNKLKRLFPRTGKLTVSDYEVIRFVDAEIKDYFRQASPDISEDYLNALCNISRGIPSRMEIILRRYVKTNSLKKLLDSDATGESDLLDDDFRRIFDNSADNVKEFFALMAYTDFPLDVTIAAEILGLSKEEIVCFVAKYHDDVCVTSQEHLRLLHEGFHKYLRRKLTSFKQKIELKTLHVLEMSQYMVSHSSFIPPLYKSLKQIDKLIAFLNKDNIQKILIDKKSQAALNEQCEFGYDACKEVPEKYAASLFRFAVTQSMSHEIERNELWDNELEALLATDHVGQAIALAENVYLSEEKLKSFLLIARKKEKLKDSDYELLKERIDQLVTSIQFEKMPEKAIELAKLLFNIDYKAAIGIVDRVVKENKAKVNADSVYTLMALMTKRDDEDTFGRADADIVDSKIENDELRSFASAAKNLFSDVSVDVFLNALSNLPSNSQKLHLLQIWLPEHEDMADIGKAVLEAVSLIVTVSDTDMPRAKVLSSVCHSMAKMTVDEMTKAMSHIDALNETIKYPTFDYVDAQLTIIEATKEKMPEKSLSLLENLFLYVDDLQDKSIRLSCLSKLLGRFDYLGKRKETERTIGPTFQLSKDIKQGIHQLMQETAYHLKVIEEPIKALICDYPRLVDELITEVNTIERRECAYSLAASQYIKKQEDEKIKLDSFFNLLSKTDASYGNREGPLEILTYKLLHSDKIDHNAAFPVIKKNLHYIENLESCSQRILLFVRLYLWVEKHFAGNSFADKIKKEILSSWDAMSSPKYKIECGYFIAKSFAKVSQSDADDILKKCLSLKQRNIFISSSSITAYNVSLELYVHSFALMVRYKICDAEALKVFGDNVNVFASEIEKAEIWSTIALEYYCANDHAQFLDIVNQYCPKSFDAYSLFDQKCTIYAISPALYLSSHETLFSMLSRYDEFFRNACLLRVLEFIFCKETALSGSGLSEKAYDLCYTDYQNIAVLLDHVSSDDVFFRIISIASKSLREGRPKNILSVEHKKSIVNELKRIVSTKLPTQRGLQHDGYKIACEASLSHSQADFSNADKQEWETRIATISNDADRSFLYLFIAPYFQKRADKEDFFNKGIKIAESISSMFDKVNRLNMSITECIDNKLGNLVQPVAATAMESLRANGTLQDYKRLVDMVYQHKPEMAEQMVNNLDNDPARVRYKQHLLDHISSTRKLEQAHKNFQIVDGLTLEEQVKFFSKQLEDLVNGKGQIIDIKRLFSLTMQHIYGNNIEESKYAVLYVMEDLFLKYKETKKYRDLLIGIHTTLLHNLKLVLSLSAGTKDRIDRVDSMVRAYDEAENDGFIRVGEDDKAWAYLVNWYRKYSSPSLIIIDPYFKPSDLSFVKRLCDINEELAINILTHRQKYVNEDYEVSWRELSSGVLTNVHINFVWYKEKSTDGPLHDRYWICCDDENDEKHGLIVNSLDSLGKKESSMNEVTSEIVLSALDSYRKFTISLPSRIKGREMDYSEMVLG